MSTTIYLDLTQQENSSYVQQLLQQFPNVKQFYCAKPYILSQQITIILRQILLPFTKPAASQKPEKADQHWHYYAVIEDLQIGAGRSGSVRPVLGVWKINQEQAVFKVKVDIDKKRALKSSFFPPDIRHHDEYIRASMAHEQIISSVTPHMSTKYPIIETEDGVHLLMRRQKGNNLETLLSWLRHTPQGLTFIQRLQLCLELYNALEKEVHTITTGHQEVINLIHRDVKPANIMISNSGFSLTSHMIDYGFSVERNDRNQIFQGTPLYMEPELLVRRRLSLETDDLFSLALTCAQLWGDVRRFRISTQTVLITENKNIQFEALFRGMPDASYQQQAAVHQILTCTTRSQTTERWNKTYTVNAYTRLLLGAYQRLSSTNPQLDNRLTALKKQLNEYLTLDMEARKYLDQEFAAADFLLHSPELLAHYPLDDRSLADIWRAHCASRINEILTAQFPGDTPHNLFAHINLIKKACTEPLLPNHQILHTIVHQWAFVNRLSVLFQRIKGIDYQVLTDFFNGYLHPNTGHSLEQMEYQLKHRIQHHLETLAPLEQIPQQCKKRFTDLYAKALEACVSSNNEFSQEWAVALQFVHLLELINSNKPELSAVNSLTDILAPEHSLEEAFNMLFSSYKQKVKQTLGTMLITYLPQPNATWLPGYFQRIRAPQRYAVIEQLSQDLDLLFASNKSAVRNIPPKIIALVEHAKTKVEYDHQQGYLGRLKITHSELANLLQKFIIEFTHEPHPERIVRPSMPANHNYNSV